MLGGLNAHVAHHLFPRVSHAHYRPLTRMIQRKAAEFGVPSHQTSFWGMVVSHYRYLTTCRLRRPGKLLEMVMPDENFSILSNKHDPVPVPHLRLIFPTMKTRYFLLPGLLLSSFALTQVRPDSTGFDSTKIRSYHVVRFRGERTRLYDSLRLRGSLPLYALTDSKMLWVRATWCRWVRRDRCARYWRTVS